jgi:hypothetical protein
MPVTVPARMTRLLAADVVKTEQQRHATELLPNSVAQHGTRRNTDRAMSDSAKSYLLAAIPRYQDRCPQPILKPADVDAILAGLAVETSSVAQSLVPAPIMDR